MISLSDKVVSRCQLLNAEMMLLETPNGLSLKWSLNDKDSKSKGIYSSPLSGIKAPGRLYPVQLNAELELALFGKRLEKGSKGCSKSNVASIVVCDTGAVLAAHQKLPEALSILCHHEEATIWAGIIKDVDERCAVTVVTRGGTIHIGLPGKKPTVNGTGTSARHRGSNLLWHKEMLKMSPVVCCGHDNVMFISDGTQSWLSVFDFTSKSKVDHTCHKLPYCGIIRISGITEDKLDLFTCDGRIYHCEWKDLVENFKCKKSSKPPEKELSCTVEEVMTGIQRCSELVQVEGKHVRDLDNYLTQLSLATSLLVEPQKDIFSATVKVEQRLEQKGSYVALLNLKKNLTRVDFEGKWWKLNVSIPGPNYEQTLCIKLDEQDLNKDINVSIPLPNLNLLDTLASIKITCHLILGHFITFHPVCHILACHASIDIFHFLTHRYILKNTTVPSMNFTSAIQCLARKRRVIESVRVMNHLPLPPCCVRLSLIANNVNQHLFMSLLYLNSVAVSDISAEDANQLQLWFQDVPVDIKYSQRNTRIVVTLSGPNPSLVLSAKAAIERRVTERGSVPSHVTLTSEVFEQAQQNCQILESESSKATTQAALSHLHHMITKLLCNVPL